MWRVLLGIAIIGCRYSEPHVGSDGSTPIPDAPPDASCKSTCLNATMLQDCQTGQPVTCPLGCHVDAQNGDRCAEPVPSNDATIDDLAGVTGAVLITHDALLDTATGGIVEVGTTTVIRSPVTGVSPEGIGYALHGSGIGVLGVKRLVIANGATLFVSGPRALIVLAEGSIQVEGVVDGSGGAVACGSPFQPQCPGPNGGKGGNVTGDGAGCAKGGKGFAGSGDETGGGGGGYATAGATGGIPGDSNPPGAGGMGTCSSTQVTPLVGGSGGGGGGTGGDGGGGGGAIQLTALGDLLVRTSGASRAGIRVNGGGGEHGSSSNGAGGGGSGGAILLEAQTVTIDDATLTANGGSGGGGNGGTDGNPGRFDDQPAAGGTGGTGGFAGGDGGARGSSPTAGSGGNDGTGGGGAGVGRIFINAGKYQMTGSPVTSPMENTGTPSAM